MTLCCLDKKETSTEDLIANWNKSQDNINHTLGAIPHFVQTKKKGQRLNFSFVISTIQTDLAQITRIRDEAQRRMDEYSQAICCGATKQKCNKYAALGITYISTGLTIITTGISQFESDVNQSPVVKTATFVLACLAGGALCANTYFSKKETDALAESAKLQRDVMDKANFITATQGVIELYESISQSKTPSPKLLGHREIHRSPRTYKLARIHLNSETEVHHSGPEDVQSAPANYRTIVQPDDIEKFFVEEIKKAFPNLPPIKVPKDVTPFLVESSRRESVALEEKKDDEVAI